MEQLNAEEPVYKQVRAVRLRGALNVDLVEKALNVIVARHEILQNHYSDRRRRTHDDCPRELAIAAQANRLEFAAADATRNGS